MVTKWLLELLAGFFGWVLSWIPPLTLPLWATDTAGYLADGMAYVVQLGNVLPIGAILNGLVFTLTVWGIALVARVARIVASFFTGGGGSAA